MDTNITGLSTGYESQFEQAKAQRVDARAETVQAEKEIKQKQAQEVAQRSPEIDEEALSKGVEDLNKALLGYGLGVSFGTDADTKSHIIKIFDKETEEIVKQYPSEDALALMKNIQNYLAQQSNAGTAKPELTGALFNEVI